MKKSFLQTNVSPNMSFEVFVEDGVFSTEEDVPTELSSHIG